jgi:hypothetical protein
MVASEHRRQPDRQQRQLGLLLLLIHLVPDQPLLPAVKKVYPDPQFHRQLRWQTPTVKKRVQSPKIK